MEYRNILLSLGLTGILIACSGEDDSSKKEYSSTVERGKVLGSIVKDAKGQMAKSKSDNSNIYYFTNKPDYPITASGGFIDLDNDGKKSDLDMDLKITLKSCNENITPLNTYFSKDGCAKVEENTKKLAQSLGISDIKSFSKLPSEQEKLKDNRKSLLLTNASFLALVKNINESGNIKENVNLQDDIAMFKSKIENVISNYSEFNARDLENKIIKNISKLDKSLEDKISTIKTKQAQEKAKQEQAQEVPKIFTLKSTDVQNNGILPNEFRAKIEGQCNGENKIPSLSWSNTPSGTKEFVITMIDMAKDNEKPIYFPHWVIAHIPSSVNSIAKNDMKQTSIDGTTYYKDPNAFGGACPPSLEQSQTLEKNHPYKITIYAIGGDKGFRDSDEGGFQLLVDKYKNVQKGAYNYYLDNPLVYLGKASITVYAKNSDFPH